MMENPAHRGSLDPKVPILPRVPLAPGIPQSPSPQMSGAIPNPGPPQGREPLPTASAGRCYGGKDLHPIPQRKHQALSTFKIVAAAILLCLLAIGAASLNSFRFNPDPSGDA